MIKPRPYREKTNKLRKKPTNNPGNTKDVLKERKNHKKKYCKT